MKKIGLIIVLLSFAIHGVTQNLNDTIKVVIDLKQVDSLGLKVNVYPPSNIGGKAVYQFPKSIPGIYEYLNNHEPFIKLVQDKSEIKCENNSFLINNEFDSNKLTYFVRSTVGKYKGISAEDTYYLTDSIYILNWHYILGYFNKENKPYKIEINKKPKLFGSGSLSKKGINDTTDIYIANNYKDLIHNPIMYCVPDTVSFQIDETKFVISCAGNDSLLNSEIIKNLIYTPLSEISSKSVFKHKEYSFLYFAEYSLTPPYLTGLEHPNSTLICYHSALLDNNIFIGSSIHEFVHSLFTPLRIRSEVINEFNFTNPVCDEFLWFYEGVTEYLTIKTLVNSGFFTSDDFLNEIEESNKYHKNINLGKVSSTVYGKKERRLFDNFYTKGSLFAMQLDVEIIKQSSGKMDLFDVMQRLQNSYNPENPFNSKTFIADFSLASGLDLEGFICDNTQEKIKVDYENLIEEVGFSKEYTDTLIWTYNIKKNHLISNYKKDRFEIAVFGSKMNEELGLKKVIIYEINGMPLTWYNDKKLLAPKDGQELSFRAIRKSGDVDFTMKPEQVMKTHTHLGWVKNSNYESDLARKFWKR